MNKTKIEWTDYSWNPITGCLHNCSYCYAKRLYNRFGMDFTPKFHEKRLNQPYGKKKGSKIFVGSTSDVFGDWVPKEWIDKVLKVVEDNPQHTFQFLTKNPERMRNFKFPDNCWVGATIESRKFIQRFRDLQKVTAKYHFISIEPLLGEVNIDFKGKGIDLVIVGANSTRGAEPPKKEWIKGIKGIKGCEIFYKSNIKKYL